MSNMSYCRFENTLNDLRECYDALCNGEGEGEPEAREQLINLCRSITEEFGEE
jgi:hypothetical protein